MRYDVRQCVLAAMLRHEWIIMPSVIVTIIYPCLCHSGFLKILWSNFLKSYQIRKQLRVYFSYSATPSETLNNAHTVFFLEAEKNSTAEVKG